MLSIKTKALYRFLTVMALGFIITGILTWPFITKISSYYKDSGDYAFDGSMLYYNQQSVKTGLIFNQKEYFNGYQYYPQPNTIAYSDHLFLSSLIYSPVYWLTGNYILSENLLALLTFVFSFVISFYVFNIFFKNDFAAITGAFVYTFNPQMSVRFPYHLGLLSHFLLPLVFLFAYKFLINPTFKNSFLFCLIFTLNSLTAVYFQILTIIFLPVFFLPFLISNFFSRNESTHDLTVGVSSRLRTSSAISKTPTLPSGFSRDKKYFIKLFSSLIIFLIFVPILFYFNSPYLNFSKNEQAIRRLEETLFFSGRIINWLFTNPNNFIYGDFVKKFEKVRSPGADVDGKFNYAEHTLFLNIIPTTLFLMGLFYLFKQFKKKTIEKPQLILNMAMLFVLTVSFILSFGPIFFGWNGEGPYWKMPYYYLYQMTSIFQGIRVPSRLQFIFYIPFAFFVSYGVLFLSNKINNKKIFYLLFIFLIISLLIENMNIRSYDEKSLSVNDLNRKIENVDFLKGKNVLHLPIHIPELGETSTYTLNWYYLTNTKSLNGYSGYAPKDQMAFLIKLKEKFDEEALKQLKVINTNFVIIHKNLLGKETEKYEGYFDLYKKGTIYENEELQIIDLNKYNFEFKICDFEKDFNKDIKMGTLKDSSVQFYVLDLKNKSDCYLPSIYEEKYKTMRFVTNFIVQTEHTVSYKLPPVISPFENIILSEITNNFKISE